jgi:hypothetical protein
MTTSEVDVVVVAADVVDSVVNGGLGLVCSQSVAKGVPFKHTGVVPYHEKQKHQHCGLHAANALLCSRGSVQEQLYTQACCQR